MVLHTYPYRDAAVWFATALPRLATSSTSTAPAVLAAGTTGVTARMRPKSRLRRFQAGLCGGRSDQSCERITAGEGPVRGERPQPKEALGAVVMVLAIVSYRVRMTSGAERVAAAVGGAAPRAARRRAQR
jgi:hypothetical protein